MSSLKNRLNLGLAGSLAVLLTLSWWLATTTLSHFSEELMVARLQHDGEALLAALSVDQNNQLQIKDASVGHIYDQVFSGHYYVVKNEQQIIRSRSLWDQQLVIAEQTTGNTSIRYNIGPDSQPLLIWTASYQRFNQVITIIMAEDTSATIKQLDRLALYFSLGGLTLLILLLLMQRLIITSSFQSMSQVQAELNRLATGEIETLQSNVPNEIKPLVDEVNRLLLLLSQRLQRSRNAMGNLAHSLKHPLSLLIQLAENDQQQPLSKIKNDLQSNTQQIQHLMERELKRARIAGSGTPGQRFHPATELPTLLDVLQRVYRDKKIHIDQQCPQQLEYQADRNDMLELLGNLLDNAYKWTKDQINIQIYTDNGLNIIIEDNGPGCTELQQQQLTQRGTRIDESVSGHGLGLSIAKDIVELYHGTLNFTTSNNLGGLRVEINLP